MTVTLPLLIEDVTDAQRDEFVTRLTTHGCEVRVQLGDGIDYVAEVQTADHPADVGRDAENLEDFREPIHGDDLPRPDEPDVPMAGDRW